MKLLYISYLTDDETFAQVEAAGLEPSVARHKFEKTFIQTLLASGRVDPEDIELISCVPYNQKMNHRPESGKIAGKTIRYIWWNNSITSMIEGIIAVRNAVRQWYKRTKGASRVIMTYATNPVIFLPKLGRRCPLVTVCSEVPRYRVMRKSFSSTVKKEYYHHLNEMMDGYIYFSKYMDEVCNRHCRPSIVVEGMPCITDDYPLQMEFQWKPEQIFYAGGLNAENGIPELLEAFTSLGREDVLLTLCGVGNVQKMVEEYAQKYSNICYLGTRPNQEILALERESTILMNPRKANQILTRYSFPSKTFEYFASGTCCMMTKLAGVPEEYYEHCYCCDSTDAQTLRADLCNVLSVDQKDRFLKAQGAFRFLLEHKTASVQTERIVEFLEGIAEKGH